MRDIWIRAGAKNIDGIAILGIGFAGTMMIHSWEG
jgi:hypothetical protein